MTTSGNMSRIRYIPISRNWFASVSGFIRMVRISSFRRARMKLWRGENRDDILDGMCTMEKPLSYIIDMDSRESRVLRLFNSILTDNGRAFPKIDVSCPRNVSKAELYEDFIRRLRKWTHHCQEIGFIDGGYPKVVGQKLLLPLDVRTKTELYRKLVVATFNVRSNHCLYGGF